MAKPLTQKDDLELEESSGKMRQLKGFWGYAASALAAGITLYHILDLTIFLLDPWLFLAYSAGLFSILTFLLFPGGKEGRNKVQAIDIRPFGSQHRRHGLPYPQLPGDVLPGGI